MFTKSTHFKQVCQLLLSLIVVFHNATTGSPQTPKRTSKEKLQKFHTGEFHNPDLDCASDWLKLWKFPLQPDHSKALLRFG